MHTAKLVHRPATTGSIKKNISLALNFYGFTYLHLRSLTLPENS
jgi:hypothetical protein